MQDKVILFDLDGTISDPRDGIVRSINYALTAHGFAERDETQLERYIGPPLDNTFEILSASQDKSLIHALVASYRERYADIGFRENRLYPQMFDCLHALARQYPLAVCTSKRGDFAEKILAMFDLTELFYLVSGADIGLNKAQQLEQLVQSGQVGKGSVMVGDRDVDLIAARHNQLTAIGVLWGYGSYAELSAERPDALVTTPAALSEWIADNHQ